MKRILAAFAGLLLGASAMAAEDLKEGVHYVAVDNGGKSAEPEVVEFFDYTCPACMRMEPLLAKWKPQKPAAVKFKRVHVVELLGHPGDYIMARAFYTAELMGVTEKVHQPLFELYHGTPRVVPRKYEDVLPAFEKAGVDTKVALSTMQSMPVDDAINRARKLQANVVRGTPTFVINNAYVFKAAGSTNEEVELNFFRTLSELPLKK